MCRLLGYVASHPTAPADVLGEPAFDAFTSLAALHGDGWGLAWRSADAGTRVVSSPDSAARDPRYAELTRQPLGAAGLVHLRWATGGLPVVPENTHPFTDGTYAFAHNGHIQPIPLLDELLTAESRAKLKGSTDSERYFRFVLQCIDETGSEAMGVTRALRTMTTEFPGASLNALLLTPDTLIAIHINSRADSPPRALSALYPSDADMPHRHATEYYAMDYRITPTAVHVISSGLDEPGWTRVPPDSAAMIDLRTRELARLDLQPVRPGG
ncbi:class II glutamine amidotransferase [Mycetocola manganoxydans]|uniref:Class II glutamine amidotransferase n=1 Tax=Mycetocola manganoxydans TaxID=699879 RepID=A0A3L6ZYX6_9MICO|nr:class II glutamine amidotransferase [Mycetocola manganoxydans]RLP73139.1 class II glutamine amidotransferase [Mycetocola manganoxydans]GHD43952.1 class II glutamine amidotransferase [Mycetocola manganoxydans]